MQVTVLNSPARWLPTVLRWILYGQWPRQLLGHVTWQHLGLSAVDAYGFYTADR